MAGRKLEPLEFRSPIATVTFSNGSKIDLLFSPEWQRKLQGLWQSVTASIAGSVDDAALLSFADAESSLGALTAEANQQSVLGLLMPDTFRDLSPDIEAVKRQLATIQDSSRPLPEIPDLETFNALMSREIPQGLNTDSLVTFAGLTITGLTAKSFLYSGTGGLLATTAAPTNGQLLIGSTGAIPAVGAIAGTANQIVVTLGAGTIVLTTPQNIDTACAFVCATLNPTTGIFTSSSDLALATLISGDISLSPAGTGRVKFGTFTAAGAETFNGTIAIKDAAGTARKVAIFA